MKNIVYSVNDLYIHAMAASIRSICKNKKSDDDIVFYVLFFKLLDENIFLLNVLSEECGVPIHLIDAGKKEYVNVSNLYSYEYLTVEMYLRLFIADILPSEEKALYMDCDTIITSDITDLYNEDISDYVLGAIYDFPNILRTEQLNKQSIDPECYFNSGVLLINLNLYRKNNILNKCIDFLEENKTLICPDQDALNVICHGMVKFLDDRWNFQWGHFNDDFLYLTKQESVRYKESMNDFRIIHFTSPRKPWNSKNQNDFCVLYWKYFFDTPFSERVISQLNGSAKAYEENNCVELTNIKFLSGKLGLKKIIEFFISWLKFKLNR